MQKNLKLKQFSLWFSLAVMFALGTNTGFLIMIQRAYNGVVSVQKHRQDAMSLANELRQETEQLTLFVRAYTSTAQTHYLTYYYDILAIRQGEKPLPENYVTGAYWDTAVAGEITHTFQKNGVAYPLSERMESLGFSDKELLAFDKVSEATEAMKQIEQIAFAATQGLYDPKKQDFVSDGKPQLKFASELVHSQKYNTLKSNLAKSVINLVQMVDLRTNTEVVKATNELERWILLSSLNMVLGIFILIIASRVISRSVIKPIKLLSKAAADLAQGDYSARTFSSEGKEGGVEELVTLGVTFNRMAESIENDIGLQFKTLEKLKIANQKAEEATRAKSMFLANMSHEIRTPMNAIIGMAYLALQTDLTTRQKDYINEVHNAAKSLLGIINDILDFSKVEAGKMKLEETRFVLENVLGDSLSLLRQRASEKEIELLLEMTDPLLLGGSGTLMGDALRLTQILTNLLSNAVKFTHHGHVKLVAEVQERSEEDLLLRFSVVDMGIGMSKAQVDGLFQEFTQADGSTTRRYGGTGLGLTISKKFVELMGGRIWVESEEGKGSHFIFEIRFPIAKPLPSIEANLPKVEILRILVVDDRREVQIVTTELLALLGVKESVDCASSGKEALKMLEYAAITNQPYDLLLLDWVMPEMDGEAVLKALQKSQLPYLPQVALFTAYDTNMMYEAVKDFGIKHFLSKPVLPEALRKLLNEVASGNIIEEIQNHYENDLQTNFDGMRVLLAEDNLINQKLAIELMESRGVDVTVVNNGQEVLDKLAEVEPDYYHLVLMDLQMPIMDGYEASAKLRADPRYAALPLVAMTAHAMIEERERCIKLGMNGHISKPIEPDKFYIKLGHYYRSGIQFHRNARKTIYAPYALPEIVGLDISEGLRRAGKNQKLYRQMLSAFVTDYSDYINRITNYIKQGEWENAEKMAHTTKGLAGTLGIKNVPDLMNKLEVACKNKQMKTALETLVEIIPVFTPIMMGLEHFFEEHSDTQKIAVTIIESGKIPECFPQILTLLNEGDSDVIHLWEHHKMEFTQILSSHVLHLIDVAVQNFEFDDAYKLLADLQK